MLRILALSLAALGLMHPTFSSPFQTDDALVSHSSLKLDRVRFQIEKSFRVNSVPTNRELYFLVQKSMNEANPKHQGLTVRQMNLLSREVVTTAQCYGIDPIIFAGLIWRESNFKPDAQSERGAVGLTQMTQTGIEEVLDRLSLTSHRRLGFLRSSVKRCNPQLLDRVPDQVSADTLAAWKNSVSFSKSEALVMGALLLKINLASTDPEKTKLNGVATYRDALERYNGDPKIKSQFAKDVLQLAKRMVKLPEVALNDSKFLSLIKGF